MKVITKYDLLFLCQFTLGLIINYYFLLMPRPHILTLILIGLGFEIITNRSWTYSDEFKKSFFTKYRI